MAAPETFIITLRRPPTDKRSQTELVDGEFNIMGTMANPLVVTEVAVPLFGPVVPVQIADTSTNGVLGTASRSDHNHGLPDTSARFTCRVATTANIVLSAPQTIDGVAVIAGDRVLVKDQAVAKTNGIYVVAAGAWSRASDLATSAQTHPGIRTFVAEGALHGGSSWLLSTIDPISLGVTSLTFVTEAGEFGTPSIVLGTAAAQGTADTAVRTDATIVAFDVAAPTTISVGDAAATGAVARAARRDHTHGLPSPAAPADVDKSAASAGASTNVARQDHKHDISTAAPVDVGTANSEGVATSLGRSDHVHKHGANADVHSSGQPVTLEDEGVPVTNTPHTTMNFVGSGVAVTDAGGGVATVTVTGAPSFAVPTGDIDIGDAAVEGVSTNATRADHQHAFPAPGVAPPAVAAASVIGVATTPARSDHTHQGVSDIGGNVGSIGYGVPVSVDKTANASGAATTVSRSDHKHDVSTGVPGTVAVGDAAAEGAATTIARSDHTHAVAAPAAPANVDKSAASAGASANVAREDHKHDTNTATAVSITDATNAEGAATTLARSNHTHAHGSLAGGAEHAVATTVANGFMSSTDKTTLTNLMTATTLTTLDGVVTTIDTVAIPADTAVLVEAYIVAKQAGGERAGYLIRALIYRTGIAGAARQGAVQNDFTRESNGGLDTDIDVSGNNAIITVKGLGATTINWRSERRTVSVT